MNSRIFSRAEADRSGDASLPIAIVTGVIGGVAMCIVAVILIILLMRKRRDEEDREDEEKGGTTFEPKDITPPPATYRGFESRSDLTLRLDDSAMDKSNLGAYSPPTFSISPPSSEDSPPSMKKWKHKRVPVPRLSRLPPSPKSRTRSWLTRIPQSPHFSRRSSRASRKSSVSLAISSSIPPLPTNNTPTLPLPATATAHLELPPQDSGSAARPALKLSIP